MIAAMIIQARFQGRRFIRRCIITLLLLTCTGSIAAAASIQSIPVYTLRYNVSFQGNSLGELEISIRQQDMKVIVRGETFPNALARMFGDGKIIETVEYAQQGGNLRLISLTEQKGSSDPETKALYIDRPNHQIIAGEQRISLSGEEQIDAYTFPLLSILGLSDTREGHQVDLVSAEKVRHYRYLAAERETIYNQAGAFKTLRKTRTRLDNSKTIAIWVTEEAPLMPVQIQIERNDGHRMMVSLISIADQAHTSTAQ